MQQTRRLALTCTAPFLWSAPPRQATVVVPSVCVCACVRACVRACVCVLERCVAGMRKFWGSSSTSCRRRSVSRSTTASQRWRRSFLAAHNRTDHSLRVSPFSRGADVGGGEPSPACRCSSGTRRRRRAWVGSLSQLWNSRTPAFLTHGGLYPLGGDLP